MIECRFELSLSLKALLIIPSCRNSRDLIRMVKKTTKDRVYLNDDEKKILAGLLKEWNDKPDKKSRDAFISSEALPKIQQLNISKYGPDIISKDKAAKMLWECRIQVSFSAFHMHTFYIEIIGRPHLV